MRTETHENNLLEACQEQREEGVGSGGLKHYRGKERVKGGGSFLVVMTGSSNTHTRTNTHSSVTAYSRNEPERRATTGKQPRRGAVPR